MGMPSLLLIPTARLFEVDAPILGETLPYQADMRRSKFGASISNYLTFEFKNETIEGHPGQLEEIRDAVFASLGITPDEFVYVGPYVYKIEDDGSTTFHLTDMLGALSLSMGIVFTYFLSLKNLKRFSNLLVTASDGEEVAQKPAMRPTR
uniref:Uncharacterized protein n=1 Tax=Caenorhabditis japonica TaxID=281687 RepID=A0A8R1HJG6_CAEJA